jgi:hypothetical protein
MVRNKNVTSNGIWGTHRETRPKMTWKNVMTQMPPINQNMIRSSANAGNASQGAVRARATYARLATNAIS